MTALLRRLVPLLSLCAATTVVGIADHAHACSGLRCGGVTVFPNGGSVPADLFSLRFFVQRTELDDAGTLTPHLYRVEGVTRVEVPLQSAPDAAPNTTVLSLAEAPAVGTHFVLEADTAFNCTQTPFHVEFDISAPAPLPASLGTLSVHEQHGTLEVPVYTGSCTAPIDADYADVTLTLAADAQPFAALLNYALLEHAQVVGGAGAPFSAGDDGGVPLLTTRLYTRCGGTDGGFSSPGAAQGTHVVHMHGSLPDGRSLDTAEVSVTLTCAGQGSDADAGTPDAQVGRPANEHVDASNAGTADAEVSGPKDAVDTHDGCSLAHGRSASGLVLALAALLVRKRRA